MKHKSFFLFVLATLLVFCALAPLTSCGPKDKGDKINHCTNNVLDEDETAVDCGGSCAPCIQPCDTIVCQNGGTCATGKCNCPSGYTGNRCQTEIRSAFTGSYLLNGTGTESPGGTAEPITNLPLLITSPAGNVHSLFLNFNNGAFSMTATLQSNGTSLTVAPQVAQNNRYQGTGNFAVNNGSTTINLNLNVTNLSYPDTSYIYTISGPRQ